MPSQAYTLTDNSFDINLSPLFSVSPAFCASSVQLGGNQAISDALQFDSSTQTITVPQILSLDLLSGGDGPVNYSVSVIYQVSDKSGVATTKTLSFSLQIKNPCIDDTFVFFSTPAPTPQNLEYIIFDSPTMFQHSAFPYETQPVSHQLCGTPVFTLVAGGSTITSPSSQPVGYDSSTRTISVESTDYSLLQNPQSTWQVTASLSNYPYDAMTRPNAPT